MIVLEKPVLSLSFLQVFSFSCCLVSFCSKGPCRAGQTAQGKESKPLMSPPADLNPSLCPISSHPAVTGCQHHYENIVTPAKARSALPEPHWSLPGIRGQNPNASCPPRSRTEQFSPQQSCPHQTKTVFLSSKIIRHQRFKDLVPSALQGGKFHVTAVMPSVAQTLGHHSV